MKISKKTLLFISGILSISALGFMFASAERNLFTNPGNAVQYVEKEIKLISTDTGNNTTATFTNNDGALKIDTKVFILGQTGNNKNTFNGNGSGSSILGGRNNYIGGSFHVILGGSGNHIAGTYNTILGGEGNDIRCGSLQTIVGGKNNIITTSNCVPGYDNNHYSVIVGGYDNNILGDYSVIMGNNSKVIGNNSVALGSGSKIKADNSFLWTDGNNSDLLFTNDAFAVIAQNGAVINKNSAHNFAKLTLGGPLILANNISGSDIKCEGGQGGGTIKIKKSNEQQLCLCSCDGSGWNSVFGMGRCLSVCNQSSQPPECGTEINRICNTKGVTYSGSCKNGSKVVEGIGAYFVDKNDVIYWSCQTNDGTIASCSGTTIGGNDPRECEVEPVAYLIPGPEINAKMISLAGDLKNIKYFKMYTGNYVPSGVTTGLISEETSPFDVTIWYDNNSQIMYYYTDAETMYLNPNSSEMFIMDNEGSNLRTIDTFKRNTSRVTNMTNMFELCSSLTELDVSHRDTTNVQNMEGVFFGCTDLKTLNVSNWNTINVTNMEAMFAGCHNLTGLDVSNWNTSNVQMMGLMFEGCRKLTKLGVSSWNTSNVQETYSMFEGCSSLTELDVSNWNTKEITDMESMFRGCSKLTEIDVSKWDTSNVQLMGSVFSGCSSLTELDVSNWNTSNVRAMDKMFSNCSNLKTIYASNKFVTNGVTSSNYMFTNDTKLVGGNGTTYSGSHIDAEYARIDGKDGLPGYFTEKVAYLTTGSKINEKMRLLAGGCMSNECLNNVKYFKRYTGNRNNVPLNATGISTNESPTDVVMWFNGDTMYYYTDASRIYLNADSSHMFDGCLKLTEIDVSNWDTSNVTDMNNMFLNCASLTELNLSNFNTSKVTDMSHMFAGCNNLINLNLGDWKTNNVIYMGSMFSNCNNLKGLDVSNWDTSKVKSMQGMFHACHSLTGLNVSNWIISGADISHMFELCTGLTYLDLSNWDTSNVTSLQSTFSNCTNLTGIDLSNRDTSRVNNMIRTFSNCRNLKTIYASNKFVTNGVTDSSQMFTNDTQLKGGSGTAYSGSHTNAEYARLDCGSIAPGYFSKKNGNYSCDERSVAYLLPGSTIEQRIIAAKHTTYQHVMTKFIQGTKEAYERASNVQIISDPNRSNTPVYIWGDNNYVIYYYSDAQTIYMNEDSSGMFNEFGDVTEIDLSRFDTSKVQNMEGMFFKNYKLTTLDISNFNTENVTNMENMFLGCQSLTSLDLSHFDTKKVTTMNEMFGGCQSLTTLDISNFNTENVTNMSSMFDGCQSLTSLDLSHFDTKKVTTMKDMFLGCQSLTTLDISNFNTENVTNMSSMFGGCQSLTTLDISNFNTENVTNMEHMFGKYYNGNDYDTNLSLDKCKNLTTIYASDKFKTNNIPDNKQLFFNCKKLQGGNGTTYNGSNIYKTYARIDKPGEPGYFTWYCEGDVNQDNLINEEDSQAILRCMADDCTREDYDLNNDGYIDGDDIQYILNMMAVNTSCN